MTKLEELCEECREETGHDCIHSMSSDRCILERFLCDYCAKRMDFERCKP